MKTAFVLLSLLFIGNPIKAQDANIYENVKSLLISQHPELDFKDKLLAIQFWSQGNQASRDCNIQFEKVYTTYYMAKLRGGTKGVITVLIDTEDTSTSAQISFGKDGIKNCLSLKLSELNSTNFSDPSNFVFDSNGKLIYSNLKSDSIFPSFQALITR